MAKTIKVELSEGQPGHSGIVRELEFREPRWDEIMTHGEPFKVHQFEGGEPFIHINHSVLKAYAEACLVSPAQDPLVLERLGVVDSRKVANAVADFFQPDLVEDAGSTT